MIRAIANDHQHYGGIACYSCKAFFRRKVSCQKNMQCSKNGNCEITKENRKRCKFCRLKRWVQEDNRYNWYCCFVILKSFEIKPKCVAIILFYAHLISKQICNHILNVISVVLIDLLYQKVLRNWHES